MPSLFLSPFRLIVIDQDALSSAVEVFELALAHRPEERREAEQAHAQRDRDEEGETAHLVALARRSEFPTTTSELSDIATAAISGVTSPASAIGRATTL